MRGRGSLCNVRDRREVSLWLKVADASQKSSSWTMQSGVPTGRYFDTDEFVLGRAGPGKYVHSANQRSMTYMATRIAKMIAQVEMRMGVRFDRVAFIDKNGTGPVGMVAFMALVAAIARRPIVLVRPHKRLTVSAIKGELRSGEKVLIVSDIATTGTSIYLAAQKVSERGGIVPAALVWMNRKVGAGENLERYGISLFNAVTPRKLGTFASRWRKPKGASPDELCYVDFGGRSVTSVSTARA